MTIRRMAIVDDATGTVENVILYDDELPAERQWPTPPGKLLVEDEPSRRGTKGVPHIGRSQWNKDNERFDLPETRA